jgi:hydrogenase maturation protease
LLIVGLGNIIMGDDGVGVRAVRELEKFKIKGVELLEGATSGISLLPHLRGKRRVIIIDAVQGGGEEPGTIYRLSEKELQKPEFRFFSLHDISLEHVLALGRELFSDEFPEEIVIYGVEVKEIKLSEELSEPVKKALPRLVELLRREMENHVFSGAGSD